VNNLEQSMKAAAAALTGKGADEIPDKLEDICLFIAENVKGASAMPVEAPADLTAVPTQEDFNGLIAKLKAAGIFK